MKETFEQLKKSWRAIMLIGSVVAFVFTAGVATAGYLGIPQRVSLLELREREQNEQIQGNTAKIERHLEQFERFLCLREAELGVRRALECNR